MSGLVSRTATPMLSRPLPDTTGWPAIIEPLSPVAPGPRQAMTSAHILGAEIMRDAVLVCHERSPRGHDARQWIADEGDDWPFSFERICDLFGLDPSAVRARILQAAPRDYVPPPSTGPAQRQYDIPGTGCPHCGWAVDLEPGAVCTDTEKHCRACVRRNPTGWAPPTTDGRGTIPRRKAPCARCGIVDSTCAERTRRVAGERRRMRLCDPCAVATLVPAGRPRASAKVLYLPTAGNVSARYRRERSRTIEMLCEAMAGRGSWRPADLGAVLGWASSTGGRAIRAAIRAGKVRAVAAGRYEVVA